MAIPISTCLRHTAFHDHECVGWAVTGDGCVTSDRAQQKMCRKSFWTPPDCDVPCQDKQGTCSWLHSWLPTFAKSIQLALGI